VRVPGDADRVMSDLANQALQPPMGDDVPIDATSAAYKLLAEPVPTLRPVQLPAVPGASGRGTSRPAAEVLAGRSTRRAPAKSQAPGLLTPDGWLRRYKSLSLTNLKLSNAVAILGKVNLGDLRRQGWDPDRRFPDKTPLNRLPLVLWYIGAGVAVPFDPTGDLIEVTIGGGRNTWTEHAFPVEGVIAGGAGLPSDGPMPGIFFGGMVVYAVLGVRNKRAEAAVRSGSYRFRLDGTDAERKAVHLLMQNRYAVFVTSSSNWHTLGTLEVLATVSDRVSHILNLFRTRDYLKRALEQRAAGMTVSQMASDVVMGEIAARIPLLPGQTEESIDTWIRQSLIARLALKSGANVGGDLDVATRLLAREIADSIGVGTFLSAAGHAAGALGGGPHGAGPQGGSAHGGSAHGGGAHGAGPPGGGSHGGGAHGGGPPGGGSHGGAPPGGGRRGGRRRGDTGGPHEGGPHEVESGVAPAAPHHVQADETGSVAEPTHAVLEQPPASRATDHPPPPAPYQLEVEDRGVSHAQAEHERAPDRGVPVVLDARTSKHFAAHEQDVLRIAAALEQTGRPELVAPIARLANLEAEGRQVRGFGDWAKDTGKIVRGSPPAEASRQALTRACELVEMLRQHDEVRNDPTIVVSFIKREEGKTFDVQVHGGPGGIAGRPRLHVEVKAFEGDLVNGHWRPRIPVGAAELISYINDGAKKAASPSPGWRQETTVVVPWFDGHRELELKGGARRLMDANGDYLDVHQPTGRGVRTAPPVQSVPADILRVLKGKSVPRVNNLDGVNIVSTEGQLLWRFVRNGSDWTQAR
jgi:hypothetical protein